MSGEGTDSGTRVVQHPGPPVPEGLAELDGGRGQDHCVTVKLGEAQRAQRGLARLPVPGPCVLPMMARGWRPSKPPSLSQFIPCRVSSP